MSLLSFLLFGPGNRLGGQGEAEGKNVEKPGGKWLQSQGEGRTGTQQWAHRHFPPRHAPSVLASKEQAVALPRKVSLLGFHERAFQAWGPHREHPACGQASKFPLRASCWRFGPFPLASAAARPGRGG